MLLIVSAIVLAMVVYFKIIKPNRYWKEKGSPYIKPWPIVGNMAPVLFRQRSLTQIMADMYQACPDKRYVGIFQLLQPALVIRDLELIKQITVKEFDTFPDHRSFPPSNADPLGSKNLFNLTSANGWHDMRATLSPAFTSSKMRMMFVLMEKCADQFVNYFQKQGGMVTVELKDSFTRFTNDVIGSTAFGVNCDSLEYQQNDFFLMGKKLTTFTGIQILKFFSVAISPTLAKLLNVRIFGKEVSDFFGGIVKETLRVRKEKQIVRPDIIHLMMEARKGRLNHENQGNVPDSGFAVVEESEIGKSQQRQKAQLTDDDITAQAVIFFFAGFDTASTLMCYVAYELALNPDIQDKVGEEIRSTLENSEKGITYEAIQGMKYFDCVISETLRKWPPVVFTDRLSVKPFTIEAEQPGEKPLHIDVGTSILISIFGIQRDPNYYPNPEKFDPERFNDENKRNIKPFTYLPFGAGPRNCIGSRFALLETKLIIVKLLQKFEIVPVKKTQIPLVLSTSTVNPLPDG